ncbi:MAG: hypothetical protein IKH57_17585 [Clostridia bacterium]|nr:hypothetical protein [Clostridia bacterium]
MEGFAWVIFVALWWLVGTLIKGIKESNKAAQNKQQQAARVPRAKAAPQAKPASSPAPKPQPAAMSRADVWEDEEDSWDERDAKHGQQSVAPRVAPKSVQAAAKHSGAKPFEAHMHTPVMGVEGEGTEGIDCCHDFMLGGGVESELEPADFLPMQEEEQAERAKALLQGVIYSEILGRRHVKRYHAKQAS